jgi:AcrR family transcriptional regulator
VSEAVLAQSGKSGGRPSRQEAARRLERLLAIAERHFLSAGYSETSLEAIAREAGVAKKTLYHHFGGKTGLFTTIVAALRRAWISELADMILTARKPELVLEAVALRLLDIGTRPEMVELHRLFFIDAHRFPEIARANYDKAGGLRGMEPLSEYLRAVAAEGMLKIDDIALATEQFTYLVLGGIRARLMLGAAARPSARERARIARQAAHIFVSGCKA